MSSKVNMNKVLEEVESFKLEYPDYTDETVSDYMRLLDNFNAAEKRQFATELGY